MAFTEAERVSIRSYCGYSARFHQVDTCLEQAMNAVDSDPDPDTATKIRALIVEADNIRTALTDALGRLKAAKVGSIILPGRTEIGMLRSEGQRICSEIAAILGVEIRHKCFYPGSVKSNVMKFA